MRQPSPSVSSFAMMRHMMSGGVPAAVALTIRIMPDGYDSAAPSEPEAENTSASSDSHNGEGRRASCFTISHTLDGANFFWGAFKVRLAPREGDKKMQPFRYAERLIPAC